MALRGHSGWALRHTFACSSPPGCPAKLCTASFQHASFQLALALRLPSPPPCWAAPPPHLTTSSLPHAQAVLFGLLILLSIAVAAACYRMKWGLTATFLVACLWALNAVVMFLGMGERGMGRGHMVWHQLMFGLVYGPASRSRRRLCSRAWVSGTEEDMGMRGLLKTPGPQPGSWLTACLPPLVAGKWPLSSRCCLPVPVLVDTSHSTPPAPPPGMLNGAKGVANDACLYGEDTVIRLLNQSIQGDTGAKVQSALRYYRESSGRQCVCLAGRKQGLHALQTGPLDHLVPFAACFHE